MAKIYNGITIFGEMGSGKDELAKQIETLHGTVEKYNIGDLCRNIMKVSKVNSKWKGSERQLGQKIANKLREIDYNIMNDYVYACIYEKNSILTSVDPSPLRIIIGGRTFHDLKYWKSKEYLIVGISAFDEHRINRLNNRDHNISLKINEAFKHNTETEAHKIVDNYCDKKITNNGTLHDLRVEAKKILSDFNFKL
ncbi:hypothetical protein CCS79_09950 [Clostridium diolis]|uniref:hypothetical protein n=1 Tax=Clostridium diolis TaxID=223919 RepID=UPI000B406D32|nr:hypothetical protein [Clostridium diolis]OVE68229.1 hypothetical protein CCS79_09950 [Clostridium diolis]